MKQRSNRQQRPRISLVVSAFDTDGAIGCHAGRPEHFAGIVDRDSRPNPVLDRVPTFVVAVGLFVDGAGEAFVRAHRAGLSVVSVVTLSISKRRVYAWQDPILVHALVHAQLVGARWQEVDLAIFVFGFEMRESLVRGVDVAWVVHLFGVAFGSGRTVGVGSGRDRGAGSSHPGRCWVHGTGGTVAVLSCLAVGVRPCSISRNCCAEARQRGEHKD